MESNGTLTSTGATLQIGSGVQEAAIVNISGTFTGVRVQINATNVVVNGNLTAATLQINATTVNFSTTSIISGNSSSLPAGLGTGSYYLDAAAGYCYLGGGGHGGSGGGRSGNVIAGAPFDSYSVPVLPGGNGGGNTGMSYSTSLFLLIIAKGGGYGGGAIAISAEYLFVGHILSADGTSKTGGVMASGGAGGSILIYATYISGAGTISANGGSGVFFGGVYSRRSS